MKKFLALILSDVVFLSFITLEARPRVGLEVIKLFPCSALSSTKFFLLINVKMPTIIVGIFTFISRINTTSERRKARNFFICRYFSFYEQLKFGVRSVELSMKKVLLPQGQVPRRL